MVQAGLVGLHDQHIRGLLDGDQPVGVLALGVEHIGSHHGGGEVQAVQQRPELGDLIRLAVHPGLGEDAAAGVVHHGEQVGLWVAVLAATAQGLAVDGDRLARRVGRRQWGWLLGGQPGADGAVQGVWVDAGQHAAHGRLGGWLPGAGQRVAAGPERGQDLAGRVAGPLADGGQGPRAGQHRADRDAEQADQSMPSATSLAGVGDLGEVAKQVTALVGDQRSRRSQPLGSRRNGDDEQTGTAVRTGHGLGYPHDRGKPCLPPHPPGSLTPSSPTRQARTMPKP
jgi:hypothetical protein